MINVINQMVQQIQAREAFYAPLKCPLCWMNPTSEGGLCSDCIYDRKQSVEE